MNLNPSRIASNASAGIVAAIAGYESYFHMRDVALQHHQRPELAALLPFSVDGMMVVASIAMVDDRRSGVKPSPVVKATFWAGVVTSVSANVWSAFRGGLGDSIVAGWPALALLLVVEILG